MPPAPKTRPSLHPNKFVESAIGDVAVSLRSDLRTVLEDFESLYAQRSFVSDQRHQPIKLEVRAAGRSRLGRRLYQVFADGQEVGGHRHSNGVFPLLEWGINLRIMATRGEYLQLHAASMVRDGQGFIFAGDSGCGKSTLAAILLSRGWGYLCDEFALVDVESVRLQPFPKALCIKEGSYPVMREVGLSFARRSDYLKELKGRVGYINPRTSGCSAMIPPAPLRFIVFPTFRGDVKPRLEPLSRGQALMELYRCCFNRHVFPQCAIPALGRLVSQAECFRLQVGSPEATAEVLESCVGPDSSRRQSDGKTSWVSQDSHLRARPPSRAIDRLATRREMLRVGMKLAYVAPTVLSLTAKQAFAAASNPSGICSTALQTGQLCGTDADCCSKVCDIGVCQ